MLFKYTFAQALLTFICQIHRNYVNVILNSSKAISFPGLEICKYLRKCKPVIKTLKSRRAIFLLITRYSLLFIRYSLLVTFYTLLVTFYSLLLTRYSLLHSCYFLLVTHCFLLVTRYYLLVTFYFTFSSSLYIRYSLLFTRYFCSLTSTTYLWNFGNWMMLRALI